MGRKKDTHLPLAPDTEAAIVALRQQCRQLVRRRALMAAGVAALPLPGLDVVADLRLFALLIDEINLAFGLSAQQIERMQPRWRLMAYEAAVGVGGMLVGKLVTREVVLQVLRRSGLKSVARQAGKLVPLAGQLASAGISFVAFRQIGDQHVEACVKVAQQLVTAGFVQPA